MKKVPSGLVPLVAVDRRAPAPIHRQIYDGYRAAIAAGNLRSGQRIPSTRALAEELGISRIPVLNAYSQLLSEGYFESRIGAGTLVSHSLPDQLPQKSVRSPRQNLQRSGPRTVSRRCSEVPGAAQVVPWLGGRFGAFSNGHPALNEFPHQT